MRRSRFVEREREFRPPTQGFERQHLDTSGEREREKRRDGGTIDTAHGKETRRDYTRRTAHGARRTAPGAPRQPQPRRVDHTLNSHTSRRDGGTIDPELSRTIQREK